LNCSSNSFLEILLEGAICGFFGLLAEVLGALLEKVGLGMIILLLILDICAGWVISEAFPEKIFKTIPVTGISLLITPLVMGGLIRPARRMESRPRPPRILSRHLPRRRPLRPRRRRHAPVDYHLMRPALRL
jgi:hypothetical protein